MTFGSYAFTAFVKNAFDTDTIIQHPQVASIVQGYRRAAQHRREPGDQVLSHNAAFGIEYKGSIMSITIYHNTACGTSRKTLEAIRASGVEPEIVDYVKNPPSRAALQAMIAKAGLTVRQAMRNKGDLYVELGPPTPRWTRRCWMR
jgi:arsenate reductase (glutaredoxin)